MEETNPFVNSKLHINAHISRKVEEEEKSKMVKECKSNFEDKKWTTPEILKKTIHSGLSENITVKLDATKHKSPVVLVFIKMTPMKRIQQIKTPKK